MKSLYGQYLNERENKSILESEYGFATYQLFDNGECYLQDIFVIPEQRKTGLAKQMADQVVEIAKINKCHTLIGSVCVDASNPTQNMKIFLAYGMQINKIIGNMIFLSKRIAS